MLLLSLIAVSCCVVALAVLALLPTDGESGSWKLAHLLLVPITVVGIMGVLSCLGHQPLTVDEALAQIAESAMPASATPTDTPFPVAPTPTDTATAAAASDTPTAQPTNTPVPTATSISAETPTPPPTSTPVTGSPTAMPSPVIPLPTLAPVADTLGTTKVATISSANGGTSITADGRAELQFAPGAVANDITLTIQSPTLSDQLPPLVSHPIIHAWKFSATDNVTGQPVSTFAQPVTVFLRASAAELHTLNPLSLSLWSLNETTNSWEPAPILGIDPASGLLTANLPHFSKWGLAGDPDVAKSTFSNGATVDLHGGGAQVAIPLNLPPVPGGLSPNLTLNYDSGRANGMHTNFSLGSATGIGWQLSPGSISGDPTSNDLTTSTRIDYSLQLAGIGGRIVKSVGNNWYMDQDQFLKIEHVDPSGLPFPPDPTTTTWRVTDKTGTVYAFGGAGAVRMKLWASQDYNGNTIHQLAPYQWDLASVTDVSGNVITYTYKQYTITRTIPVAGPVDETLDAVLTKVSWTSGTAIDSVEFDYGLDYPSTGADTGCVDGSNLAVPCYFQTWSSVFDPTLYPPPCYCADVPYAAGWPRTYVRRDMPRDVPQGGCLSQPMWYSPSVMESKLLKHLRVKVGSSLWRQYDFQYQITPFSYTTDPNTHCAVLSTLQAGQLLLKSLAELGADGSSNLRSMNFTYSAQFTPVVAGGSGPTQAWPLLSNWSNGLGGSVDFAYSVAQSTPHLVSINPPVYVYDPFASCWSVAVVTMKTAHYGGGQPQVQTGYAYSLGPDGDPTYLPTDVCGTVASGQLYDWWQGQRYLGFGSVTETTDGVTTTHLYTTSRSPGDWAMTGRETSVTEGDGVTRTDNTWNYSGGVSPDGYQTGSRFVFLDHNVDTIAGGQQLKTDYFYDCATVSPCYGLLTKVHNEGDPYSTNDDTWVTTPYTANTTNWTFVPQYALTTDVDPTAPGAQPVTLRRKNFTYDGAGRLTQTATLLDSTTNTFSTVSIGYDFYGNVNSETGDVPGGAHTMTFDPVFNTFPATVSNALGQTTTYTGDPISAAINGTDVKVAAPGPNGHVTHTAYDTFGRPTKMWDEGFLDDANNPTRTYGYTWGAPGATNETRVSDRITSGQAAVRTTATCVDGFGREIERRDQYSGSTFNSVRTDYNARGLKAARTNAQTDSTVVTCPPSPAAVFGRDRTLYAYDALNNPTTTTFGHAGLTPSCGTIVYPQPCTRVTMSGLTTTTIDGNGHKTVRFRSVAARTETVQEYTGTGQAGDPYLLYATTTYSYDLMHSLTRLDDAAVPSNRTTLGYDAAGRKTSMTDPDWGAGPTATTRPATLRRRRTRVGP